MCWQRLGFISERDYEMDEVMNKPKITVKKHEFKVWRGVLQDLSQQKESMMARMQETPHDIVVLVDHFWKTVKRISNINYLQLKVLSTMGEGSWIFEPFKIHLKNLQFNDIQYILLVSLAYEKVPATHSWTEENNIASIIE